MHGIRKDVLLFDYCCVLLQHARNINIYMISFAFLAILILLETLFFVSFLFYIDFPFSSRIYLNIYCLGYLSITYIRIKTKNNMHV